jgi:hypothetical protein
MSFEHQLDQAVWQLLHAVGDFAKEKARNTNLFHTSPSFRDKIISHQLNQNTQIVVSQAPWSSYLEDGNPFQGFLIRPKNKKALRFIINGQEIFSNKATAHGPLPFMQEAAEATDQAIARLWDRIAENSRL